MVIVKFEQAVDINEFFQMEKDEIAHIMKFKRKQEIEGQRLFLIDLKNLDLYFSL